jgi:hypothetical protein
MADRPFSDRAAATVLPMAAVVRLSILINIPRLEHAKSGAGPLG